MSCDNGSSGSAPVSEPGLVSTIIPVYNRPARLPEAVASVLAQTYRPIEIIIVDDGSTDETPQVANRLACAYPAEIRVIHQANTGPGLAREAGRRLAQGEFIQYLDSDDLLAPDKFALQVAGLRAHPDCGISYGMTTISWYDRPPGNFPLKRTGERIEYLLPACLQSRWWSTLTPLYRREVCDWAGPWTSLRLEEDWEYDCRVGALGVRLHFCPHFIAHVRDHPESRLGGGGRANPMAPSRLRDRAQAHTLMFGHARRAGISPATPEMRHFSRALFLLARQCGAAGLVAESQKLFGLAQQAAGESALAWDFQFYGTLARLIGWRWAGALACWSDRLRR